MTEIKGIEARSAPIKELRFEISAMATIRSALINTLNA